jgi:hypothetical protein
VRQWACTTTPTVSAQALVRNHPAPSPPSIHAPLVPGSWVAVDGPVLGAFVEVYLGTEIPLFIGAAIADSSPALVAVNRTLQIGDRVRARETMCHTSTDLGPEAQVVRPPPQAPALDSPGPNEQNVAVRPTFKWHDPGASGEGRADSFEIVIAQGSTVRFHGSGLSSPTFQPSADLAFSTAYMWLVRAHNTSGDSGWTTGAFSTGAVQPPPAPHLDSYDVSTLTLHGHGFLPSHKVRVRLSMLLNSVLNSYGQAVADTRDSSTEVNSDAQGRLNAVIDPKEVLPSLYLSEDDPVVYGSAPGEVVHISATDGRSGQAQPDNVLWSNTLDVPYQ